VDGKYNLPHNDGDSMRSDSKPDLQRYGATALKGGYYQMDSFIDSQKGASTSVPSLCLGMGWLVMCGRPVIFTFTDGESVSFGFSDPQIE